MASPSSSSPFASQLANESAEDGACVDVVSEEDICGISEQELQDVLSQACKLARLVEGEGALQLDMDDIRKSCMSDPAAVALVLHQGTHQMAAHKQVMLPYLRRHFIRQTSYKMAQQQPVIPPLPGGDELLLPWHHTSDAPPPLSPTFEETNEDEDQQPESFSFDTDKMDFS
jgi:hypothetical protein